MERDAEQESEAGITISLPVPARNTDLFRHKATDDVLSLLSRHRFDEFSVAELATQTGHPKPTVGRAVDVLADNGLVTATYSGNRRLVRIERGRLSVPDDPYLRIPQPEFHEPVKAAVEELRARLDGVLGVVLHGSVARGEADRRSDVDIWVLVRENRAERRRTANEVERDLEDREFEHGRYEYDVQVEALASIPRYTDDVRGILVSGITLYDTPEFETVTTLLRDDVEEDG